MILSLVANFFHPQSFSKDNRYFVTVILTVITILIILKRQPVCCFSMLVLKTQLSFLTDLGLLQFLPVVRMPGELSDQEDEEVEEVGKMMHK